MSVTFVRSTLGGFTVRAFFRLDDAINAADVRAKQTGEPHFALETPQGFFLKNLATKKVYDVDGKIPDAAALAIT